MPESRVALVTGEGRRENIAMAMELIRWARHGQLRLSALRQGRGAGRLRLVVPPLGGIFRGEDRRQRAAGNVGKEQRRGQGFVARQSWRFGRLRRLDGR